MKWISGIGVTGFLALGAMWGDIRADVDNKVDSVEFARVQEQMEGIKDDVRELKDDFKEFDDKQDIILDELRQINR